MHDPGRLARTQATDGDTISGRPAQSPPKRVIAAARDVAAGTATIQDLTPQCDSKLLEIFASGDLTALDAWIPDEMTRIAGNFAHEVGTWIAGCAALRTAGSYTVRYSYYRHHPQAHRRPRSYHGHPQLRLVPRGCRCPKRRARHATC
jgi:hypothetical protein